MQAVKGHISNGFFTPNYEVKIPSHAEAILVFTDSLFKPELPLTTTTSYDETRIKSRIEGLKNIEAALALIDDEDLFDFPKQGLMKLPEEYPWFEQES